MIEGFAVGDYIECRWITGTVVYGRVKRLPEDRFVLIERLGLPSFLANPGMLRKLNDLEILSLSLELP